MCVVAALESKALDGLCSAVESQVKLPWSKLPLLTLALTALGPASVPPSRSLALAASSHQQPPGQQ